ncbi:MAG: chloride channel protein, partial [Planctomycetia bacterium]|nr:chloride channel protein [Planctomycetia bacterium]
MFPWEEGRFGDYFSPVIHAVKLFFLVVFVAVPAALTGIAFRLSVTWANHFRAEYPGLIWFLPIGGIMIAFLYRFCRISHRGEIASIMEAVQVPASGDVISENIVSEAVSTPVSPRVSPLLAPLVFVTSLISHFFGASVGCEGASILLGGGVGAQCARFFRMSGKDFGIIVFCAMASAFSPLLGTPFAAAVFVLERCHSRRYFLFIPCLIASLIAFSFAEMLGLEPLRWELACVPEIMSGKVSGIVSGTVLGTVSGT